MENSPRERVRRHCCALLGNHLRTWKRHLGIAGIMAFEWRDASFATLGMLLRQVGLFTASSDGFCLASDMSARIRCHPRLGLGASKRVGLLAEVRAGEAYGCCPARAFSARTSGMRAVWDPVRNARRSRA